ncbi:MFS transporter [Sphaerisporangium sp. TRM90804]|uniref:MFS transporter n=1 Tax=Sphaerisporangium sp. TRM90804 TaxID=3031113 RepID=UPI00244BBA4A|nr:MFS transporter [Sphaerisporangium sp. TRM90804]MDH2429947.1 MFS transporter [Sphaerisporangium sp. TRM90804]
MTTAVPAEAGTVEAPAAPMTHRQILEALSGLLLGMFVAILSSTVVANALPTIMVDLHADGTTYTWVITASLLATTVSTPIWGKLADLMSKKLLVQLGLVIFVAGSAIAGVATSSGMLIGARVIQGLGVGGLTALAQTIMAVMASPRERGRYAGYFGSVFAVATISGPLIGGLIVDTSWLGWRWCFYVGVPFAVVALIVLQRTLDLPVRKRRVKVDWAGATLVAASVSLLLVWVSFAGTKYDWVSWQSAAMVGGSLVLALIFLLVESRAADPVVPIRLFRRSAISLATVASLLVGVAMFGATTFLSQYFQLARGETPTVAGVMTMPMILGLAVSSYVTGQIISRTGRWKALLVTGGVALTAGFGLMGAMRYDTAYWLLAVYMVLIGAGVGMTMQNLVLSVQNQVEPEQLGAASASVAFFRSLGGAVGVAVLGALLAHRVASYTEEGLAKVGVRAVPGSKGAVPDIAALPGPVRTVVESAYGHGVGDVFLYAAPAALLALVAILFIKEVPLRTSALSSDAAAGDGNLPGRHAQRDAGAPAPATAPSAAAVNGHGEAAAAVPSGHGVYGFVRGADGLPVGGAAVTLIDVRGHQLGRAISHADGGYALWTPGGGTYVLIASADEHDPQVATVVVGAGPLEFDVVLAGSGRLAGTVTDTGGAPVSGAMVLLTDPRGEVVTTGVTGPEGSYAFAGVVTGAYTLAVSATGRRPVAVPVAVATGLSRQDVVLPPGAHVRGTVRVRDAGPLGAARVTLLDAAGDVVGTVTTGEDGRYAFDDLTGGQYTVIATGYPPVAGALDLTGQGEEAYDLWLGHPAHWSEEAAR